MSESADPMRIAKVALNLPIDEPLDYRIPEDKAARITKGTRLLVPLGRRKLIGICVDLVNESPFPRLKEVLEVLDPDPLLDPALIELARFAARYYCCSIGEALAATLPAPVRKARANTGEKKEVALSLAQPAEAVDAYLNALPHRSARQAEVLRFLRQSEGCAPQREIFKRTFLTNRSPIDTLLKKGIIRKTSIVSEDPLMGTLDSSSPEDECSSSPPRPTPEQALAIEQITPLIRQGNHRTLLIWGVTGSGKTELYLRSIEATLAEGKKAIVLLPEIALTPQTVRRFRERFDRIAVLHSHLADHDRLRQWKAIKRGDADVVIGARSALFAPVNPLGIIVVDEEHEPSYKQQSNPRYQARDLAIVRAKHADAIVLLGSATPSLESFENSRSKKYDIVRLASRVAGRTLPRVETIDLSQEHAEQKRYSLLSRRLVSLMHETLDRGDQVILFLNRRGFATIVRCKRCGRVETCDQCEISRTYHQSMNRLLCHYCGSESIPPTICLDCQTPGVSYLGLGTEKIEEELAATFPKARVARMDSDSMQGVGAYERILTAFQNGQIQILIGTQMIAKGHDFPNVTLVGIILADVGLNLPDFRAAERTFQLVAQAAGRSGRGSTPGKVILQAYSVDHYSLIAGAAQDYAAFAKIELEHRKAAGYPPFGKLARIVIRSPKKDAAELKAKAVQAILNREIEGDKPHPVKILGPAPLFRLRGEYRFQILLKADEATAVLRCLRAVRNNAPTDHTAHVILDMDPMG